MLNFLFIVIIILVVLWAIGKIIPDWKNASLKDKVTNINFVKRQAEYVKDISIEKFSEAKEIVAKIKST